jgi:hypothetical protein
MCSKSDGEQLIKSQQIFNLLKIGFLFIKGQIIITHVAG